MHVKNILKSVVIGAAALMVSACQPSGQGNAAEAQAELSEQDKIFYFVGTQLAQSIRANLSQLDLTDDELALVARGVQEGVSGTAIEIDPAEYQGKFEAMVNERVQIKMAAELEAGQAYLAEMAAVEGAVTTESGLIYQELEAGTGAQPLPTSKVRAHYHGTLRDGSVFDSSVDRGQPLEIGLNQVIPCWTEGIALMKVGGKAKLTCPSNIAYGERAQGMIPSNAVLSFEVELLEVL